MNKKSLVQNILVGIPFLLSLSALIGWNVDITGLKEAFLSHSSLKFSASVALFFQTISSFCVVNSRRTKRAESIIMPMMAFSAFMIMSGFLKQFVNLWKNGFDLCHAPYDVPCLAALLCCSSFVFIDSFFLFVKTSRFLAVNTFASLIGLSLSLLGMIIHSMGPNNILHVSDHASEVGVTTAFCFFCLGLSHLLIGSTCKIKK